MKRNLFWPGLVLGALCLWALSAAALNSAGLQIMEIKGRLLDPKGRAMAEFAYLAAGVKYQLLPGASLELVTVDGRGAYHLRGPGILVATPKGGVSLNGRVLAMQGKSEPLAQAGVAGGANPEQGGVVMRAGGPQTIRVQVKSRDGQSRPLALYAGYHALVIGVGAYAKGWPRLENPVKDAREVAAQLKAMGFTTTLLLDPKGSEMKGALYALITGAGRQKQRGILIWYSGHGHTLAEADGSKLGYLVPVDAPDPDRDEAGFMDKAVSMRQMETVALRIHAKHVLMLFDSCFSGAIFQTTRARPSPFIEEKVAKPVRQFITAGNETEKVPDRSVFKTVFLQGLRDGYADLNKDGYLTGQELGAYLQEQVVNYSRKSQHPQFGKINNPKLDKGDFVFVLAGPQPPAAPKQAKAPEPPKPAPARPAAPAAPQPRQMASLAPPAPAARPANARVAISQMLAAWEGDWNRFDRLALLSHYAREATVETRTRDLGVITVNKFRFSRILEKKLPNQQSDGFSRSMIDKPRISLEGDKAQVRLLTRMEMPQRDHSAEVVETLQLLWRGGRWLIVSYNFEPRGVGNRRGPMR